MSWTSALSDWLLYIVSALVTAVGGYVGRVDSRSRTNKVRLDDVERKLEGDETDDLHEGVIPTVLELQESVECLDEKLDEHRQERKQEHRQVLQKVEEISDD